MKHVLPALLLGLSPLMLAACDNGDRQNPQEQQSPVSDLTPWEGRWNGVEGTYLELKRTANGYEVTIANLDGPRTFDITGTEGGVEFVRDGKIETILPGNGDDTGMKWLAGKQDCLVISGANEGYCRD